MADGKTGPTGYGMLKSDGNRPSSACGAAAGSAKFAPADLQEEEYNTEEEPSAYPTGHSLFLPNVQQ